MAKNKNKRPFSSKIGSVLDGVVSVIAPGAGLKRKRSRIAGDILGKSKFKSYKGAEKGRMHGYWNPGSGSADQDNLVDLEDLRDRSRDMVRNDALASGIMLTFTSNVVGTGIKPQSRYQNEDPEKQTKFQAQAELAWNKWVPFADAGARQDFYGLQNLVFQQTLENGEPFAMISAIKDSKRPFSLALEIIEADRIATPTDKTTANDVRMGIKIGKHGEPLGYWVRKTHPGDYNYNWRQRKSDNYDFIPAKQPNGRPGMIHLYKKTRAGQTRGVPLLAPVLGLFKDMSEYIEAELVANLMAACFGVFIKSENADGMAETNFDQTNGRGQREIYFEPGMVEYLNPGEEITSFMPQRPGAQFDSFIVRIIRQIGAAIGFPLELIAKDFSKTNYSSARAALLEARRVFQQWQAWMSIYFNQPIWEMVLEEAFLKGELDAPDFYENFFEYTRARWVPPGWQWVDPLKEVKAAVEGLDNGIESLADISASLGKNWEETIEQKAREAVKIKELEEKFDIVIIKGDSAETDEPQGDDEDDNNESNK